MNLTLTPISGERKATVEPKIHPPMKAKNIVLGACATLAVLPSALQAQSLFSDTLQSAADAANWNINHSGSDYQAVFGFNYSTVGIPQDPWLSGSSTALKFQVNQTAGVQQGITVSPIGQSFTGNYTMSFDLFCNYIIAGTGSTQIANYGIGTSGTTPIWSGNNDGLEFGNILDNGSGTSYRGYLLGTSIGATPFVGGSQSYASAYHAGLFPSVSIPAGETAIYPSETGSSVAGTISFQWVQVSIAVFNGLATESINGNLIATNINVSALTHSDIFLGLYDSNNGSANTIPDLNFALFDNVNVVATPEPATCALAVLGGAGMFLARRRSRKA